MSNFLYKLGGYDPKIIDAGRYCANINNNTSEKEEGDIEDVNLNPSKYLIPGFTIIFSFFFSLWGGHQLGSIIVSETADTLFLLIGFTIVFAFVMALADYFLIHQNKKFWIAFLRIILSIVLGALVSVLTLLAIYKGDIEATLFGEETEAVRVRMEIYDGEIQRLEDTAITHREYAIHFGEQATRERHIGNPELRTLPGRGPVYHGLREREAEESFLHQTIMHRRDSLYRNRTNYETKTRIEIQSGLSGSLNGQIRALYNFAKEEPVSWFVIGTIFFSLFILNLLPFLTKYGLKNDLDRNYQKFLCELRNNTKFHNTPLKRFEMEIEKENNKIDEKIERDKKESRRIKEIDQIVEDVKKEYAKNMLQGILDDLEKNQEA